MTSKKGFVVQDGDDPLSSSKPADSKKGSQKTASAFENSIIEEHQNLLGKGPDKKTEFVIKKNLTSNYLPSEQEKPKEKKFPFSFNSPFNNNKTKSSSMNMNQSQPNMPKREQSDDSHDAVIKNKSSASMSLENYGFSKEEVIPGEGIVAAMRCYVMLMQFPSLNSEGDFIITFARIIFKPRDPDFFRKHHLKEDYLTFPLGFIQKFEKTTDKKQSNITYVDIYSKDGRIIKLKLIEKSANDTHYLLQYLHVYAFPDKKEYFFAFEYGKSAARELEDKYQGWKIYDIQREFKRQKIDFEPFDENRPSDSSSNHAYRIIDNRYFRICSTYPEMLLIPAKISDQAVQASSRFRTKERLPAITFYYSKTGAVLGRSSQSKPGLYQNRCPEDELLLRYMGNPYYNESMDTAIQQPDLYIYDARPYINAIANRMNGKGFEDTKWYKNCEIYFMDIENIHHVRESYRKLLNLCYSPDSSTTSKWNSQVDSTGWIEILSYIINASIKVANSLRKGRNCLVHCSDGWDRTAQILALTQIMLDPYFRTIEGLEVLIEKDWISFGHQFNLRMGHGNKNDKDDQRSPVFLQFLDCVQQFMVQFPFAFEFNDKFLADIAYYSYSCQFGNFLCNTQQEMLLHMIKDKTISLWSFLNSQKEKYLNPFYMKSDELETLNMRPSGLSKHLRLWEEHYLYYSYLSKPQYRLFENIQFNRDFYEHMYVNEKNKVKNLKSEIEALKKKLKEKDGELAAIANGGQGNSNLAISKETSKVEEYKVSDDENQGEADKEKEEDALSDDVVDEVGLKEDEEKHKEKELIENPEDVVVPNDKEEGNGVEEPAKEDEQEKPDQNGEDADNKQDQENNSPAE